MRDDISIVYRNRVFRVQRLGRGMGFRPDWIVQVFFNRQWQWLHTFRSKSAAIRACQDSMAYEGE
jgi:hypothetical protein